MLNKMAIRLCFDVTGTTYDFWVSTSTLFLTVSAKNVIIFMSYHEQKNAVQLTVKVWKRTGRKNRFFLICPFYFHI